MLKSLSNYSQPESYHFSEESLFLVDLVLNNQTSPKKRILDIGAGCGVIGLEYCLQSERSPKELHLIEPQEVFQPHLRENCSKMNDTVIEIHSHSIQDYQGEGFDLILSNPPYYDPSKGRKSENHVQNMCRFSSRLSPADLMASIERLLSKNGEAWVIVGNKKEQNHFLDEFSHQNLEPKIFETEKWSVLRFVKLNED